MAVSQLVTDGVIGSAVYRRATASTNSDALSEIQNAAHAAKPLPRLYLADQQTAGRGRQGNRWQSRDDALTFTLAGTFGLASAPSIPVSIVVGVAAARAIDFVCAPARVALKWPNDLCFHSQTSGRVAELTKLGGILIESVSVNPSCIVIGIGVNVGSTPDLVDAAATEPSSLAQLAGRSVRRDDVLTAMLESIAEAFDSLREGTADIVSEYRDRCALTGSELSLRRGDQEITGRCLGISDDGSLRVSVDGVIHDFRSGQINRIRPR